MLDVQKLRSTAGRIGRTLQPSGRVARVIPVLAGSGKTQNDPHLQLATALIPKVVDVSKFIESLYQWAATITSSGSNLPLALPLRVNRRSDGFEMSMLRIRDKTPVSVADIVATVEPVQGKGDVLFIRFFEGEGSDLAIGDRDTGNSTARLKTLSQALVDLPLIMSAMPSVIKRAVVIARDQPEGQQGSRCM